MRAQVRLYATVQQKLSSQKLRFAIMNTGSQMRTRLEIASDQNKVTFGHNQLPAVSMEKTRYNYS